MKCLPVLACSVLLNLSSTFVCAAPRPNIVLILVDDMGFSDISPYGGEIPTPNLDRLAKEGLRFTQFYNASRCCPTRASLITGLYPHQTGIGHMTTENYDFDYGANGYHGQLNRNCVTMAEVLKSAGYHTYMTGKWHLGSDMDDRPRQRGFDEFYGSLSGAFSYFKPSGERSLMEGNDTLPAPDSTTYYTTDAFTDHAIDWISRQDTAEPFFLYLAYNAPHWPLHAKPADIALFKGKYLAGWDQLRAERFDRQVKMGLFERSVGIAPRDPEVRSWEQVSPHQKEESDYRMSVYAAQLHSVDENIGKLLASLEARNQLDNTLILFLSDNGACAEPYKEFGGRRVADINNPDEWGPVSVGRGWANLSNTPYREYKNHPEEGGIITPMIAYWPAGIAAPLHGKFARDTAHIIDLMPTLIDLTGANYPSVVDQELIPELPGKSLAPFFVSGSREPAEFLFFEHEDNCAVRHGDWKAISRYGEYNWQLYNLATDPLELSDISDQHPAIVARLDRAWKNWALNVGAAPKGDREGKGYPDKN